MGRYLGGDAGTGFPGDVRHPRLRGLLARHRYGLEGLATALGIVLVMGYVAFEVDIFLAEGAVTPSRARIELDEILLISAVLTLALLALSIRRYRAQKRETARRIRAEQQARELAYQDPLTGLANRRQFEEALKVAAAAPPKAGAAHAVLLLDLNGFKQVNDVYGHAIGDELLIVVAQRLLRAVRDGDLVARLGGDEFVVLATHVLGAEAATSIALRIIQGIAEPVVTGSIRHEIGAGIGIALLPVDAQTPEEAMRRADVALYRAKAEHRSGFRFFEEDMDRLVRERQRMEAALREAIGADLIQPRFRACIDLGSGAVLGWEAVPGWTSAEGEVPPERFLPIAEETGLVHAIGRRVLERACSAALAWPEGTTLSLGVLPGQLQDRGFGQDILECLRAVGFPPACLEIAVGESMIVHELEAAKAAFAPLYDAGVRVVLDNFGTGYSTLYHMQEFRFDKVRIDRRLVGNLDSEEGARMVRALAGLGHGLGLTVSADGLAADGSALSGSGVEEVQSPRLVTGEDVHDFYRRPSG